MPRATWLRKNPEKARTFWRAKRKRVLVRIKQRLFDLLGDKCARCGLDDKRVLQVDHINGYQGKRESYKRSGTYLYRHIISGRLPKEDYQILCANCNWIKKFENKEVPGYHQKRGSTP